MMKLNKDFINKLPELFLLIAMLSGNIVSPLYAFANDVLPEKKVVQDFKLEGVDRVIAAMIGPMATKPTFPSTNDNNITKNWGNVTEIEKTPGETKFLIKSTRDFLSCFEYRTDGDTSQKISETNPNSEIADGRYPSICVQNGEKTLTLKAITYVEFRLSFGAEKDERFDWTRFDIIPKPSTPTNGTPNNISIPTNNFDFEWDSSTGIAPITYEFQSSLNPTESNGVLTTGLWKSNVLPSNMIHSSGAKDGKWYWQVRAIDNNGNKSDWSEIWNVLLDTIKPTKPTWTAPEDGLMTNINNVTLKWESTDVASGIKGYYFRYVHTSENGTETNWETGLVSSTANSRTGSYGHGNGKYEIYVKTVDNTGNVSEESDPLTITYDGTAPATPTGLYFKAVDNTVVACGGYSNTKHITEHWDEITGDDSFSHYEYSSFDAPDGSKGLVEKEMNTNSFDSSWWTIPREGTYGFQVRSVDKFGNKSPWRPDNIVGMENACTITIDWTPPIVSDIKIDKTYVKAGDEVTITADVVDTGSGVKAVSADFSYNSEYTDRPASPHRTVSMKSVGENKYQIIYKVPTEWKEGLLYITVAARDKVDNYIANRDLAKITTVDNTPPTVQITSHSNDALIEGNIEFKGTVTDDNLSKYSFKILDIHSKSDNTETGFTDTNIYTWDTTELANGKYQITLEASDKAGNTSEQSISVTVNNPAESTQETVETTTEEEIIEEEVLGTSNQTNTTKSKPKTTKQTLAINTNIIEEEKEEEEEIIEEEIIETTSVLGEEERTCTTKGTVSGNIFEDKNDNGILDENEKTFKNVNLKIYVMENGEKKVIQTLTTDEKGYFETTLCAGKYNIEIEEETIPSGYEVKEESLSEIEIIESEEETADKTYVPIIVENNKTFIQKYWYWILLPLVIIVGSSLRRKKKE